MENRLCDSEERIRLDRRRLSHGKRRRVHYMAAWHLESHDTPIFYNQPRFMTEQHPNCLPVTQLSVGQGPGWSTASNIFCTETRKGLKLYVAHFSPTYRVHYDSLQYFSSTDKRGDDEALLTPGQNATQTLRSRPVAYGGS